jgi:hypothetical protein
MASITGSSNSQSWDSSGLDAALNNLTISDVWVINFGASTHMSFDDGTLSSTRALPTPQYVTVDNDTSMLVFISGHIFLHTPSRYSFVLNNILHVPKLIRNILSINKFTRDNFWSIEFDSFGFSMIDIQTKIVIFCCNSSREPYTMLPPTKANKVFTFLSTIITAKIWHCRLGHAAQDSTASL